MPKFPRAGNSGREAVKEEFRPGRGCGRTTRVSTLDRIAGIDDFWTREFAYYLNEHRHPLNRLTHMFGVPLLIVSAALALRTASWTLFVGGWTVGWAIQILGHRIEGNRPALLKRPISWLMGPLMVLVELLELLGLHFAFAARARRTVGL